MPRAIWKGAVSFGLVSIPVKLYTATEEKDVAFHMLHKKDHARIKQQRYCPEDDAVVEWNDVVRGYEIAPDQYVVMEPEDFDKVPVDTTHTIEITDFVPLDQIDPIYYQKTYYLEPEKTGGKPFTLLREVLEGLEADRPREGDAAPEGAALHAAPLRKHDRPRDDVLRRRDPQHRRTRRPGSREAQREGADDGQVARRHAHRRVRAGETLSWFTFLRLELAREHVDE